MKKTHVLFDFDGTLVDSAPAILTTFAQVLQGHGLQACCSIDDSLIGPPLRQTLQTLCGSSDAQLLDTLASSFRDIYDGPACLATPAYPGWDDALAALRALGLQLLIATNKRLLPTQRIIQARGWSEHFKVVYASDSCPGGFPNKAAMIAALLEEHGIDAQGAIYLGDTEADASAATANAVEFWAVDWGYGEFAGQYPTFDRPAAVVSCLSQMSLLVP